MGHLKIEISGDIEKGKVSDLKFLVNGTEVQHLDMFSNDGMFAPVIIALCMDRMPNAAQTMVGAMHCFFNQKGYAKMEIDKYFNKMRKEN